MAELAKTLISKTTLGSDQSSVVFSSIPSSYTSLVLLFSIRTTNTTAMASNTSPNAAINITLNSQTSGTNSSFNYFRSYNTDVYTGYTYPNNPLTGGTYFSRIGDVLTDGNSANSYTAGWINFNNYSRTDQTKIFMGCLGGYSTSVNGSACYTRSTGVFGSTSAISSISISPVSGLVKANSSFSLYGILTA